MCCFVIVLVCCIFYTTGSTIDSNDIPNLQHRIIGGENASIYEFSYQVSIQAYQQHFCGGAILDSKFILSAAHCFSPTKAKSITIRVGSNYTRKGGTLVKACQILVHKDYNTTTMDNDIALLKLCEPLRFSSSISPISLPNSSLNLKPGTMATVSGWGYEEEDGILSSTLKRVEVPIVSQRVCKQKYKYVSIVTSGNICAGFTRGGKDACQGDSGGPLVVNHTIIGIVSYGLGCARNYPGVYTNVSKYLDWIYKFTNLTRINDDDTQNKHWYDTVVGWFKNSSSHVGNTQNNYIFIVLFLIGILLK